MPYAQIASIRTQREEGAGSSMSYLMISTATGRICKIDIFLKFENMQRTGSFKIRGAFNKLSSLTEAEKRKGVVACSAGN
ncbi:pyridoxal-phosphate dependent enzyme, partial [Salmonella enterica subsp. enterica serovar Virginia]|nr:pyridoxal-phosphate dependent enzyme [Salmonella enterica subsp. enterica serovar Virginia]